MNIGQRIRKRREALNITQLDIAKALGVTPQHISAVEQDKRNSQGTGGYTSAYLGGGARQAHSFPAFSD